MPKGEQDAAWERLKAFVELRMVCCCVFGAAPWAGWMASCVCVYVCLRVCVCVWMDQEREERETASVCVCVHPWLCVGVRLHGRECVEVCESGQPAGNRNPRLCSSPIETFTFMFFSP